MIPLGAWGRDLDESPGTLVLDVSVFSEDGKERLSASRTGPADFPEALGVEVAKALRAIGARALLERREAPDSTT